MVLKRANIVFNNSINTSNIVLAGGVIITADPPISASAAVQAIAPQSAVASMPVQPPAMQEAHQTLFGFDTNSSMVTSDLSVLNMNAAPQLQAANNATVMTASNTGSLVRTSGMIFGTSGMTGVVGRGGAPAQVADDDNSYIVGYMGRGGETEAAICSDAEIGIA